MAEINSMPPIELHGLYALTDPNRLGGIPIGIAFDHHGSLTPDARRRVATQSSLPQTLFVSPSIVVDFHVDCWSTTRRISASPTDIIGVMGLLQENRMLPRRYVTFDSTLGITTATTINGTPVIEQLPAAPQKTRPMAAATAQLCAKLAAIFPSLFQSRSVADPVIAEGFLMLHASAPLEIEMVTDQDAAMGRALGAAGIEGLVAVDMEDRSSSDTYTAFFVGSSGEMIDPLRLGGVLARHIKSAAGAEPINLAIKQYSPRHSRICHAIAHPISDRHSTESLLIGGTYNIGPICHFSLSDSAA